MASSFSSVMLPRARMRSRWISGDGRDHHHRIDALLAAGLEQQRHVHHRDRRAGAFGIVEEFLVGGAQHRMNDLLEPLHRGGIVHHLRRQLGAIDLAVDGGARKRRLDRRRRLAFVELVNGGIGVVDRHAGLREQFCGGRFAHPDRAGQSKDPIIGAAILTFTPRAAARCAETPATAAAAGRGW